MVWFAQRCPTSARDLSRKTTVASVLLYPWPWVVGRWFLSLNPDARSGRWHVVADDGDTSDTALTTHQRHDAVKKHANSSESCEALRVRPGWGLRSALCVGRIVRSQGAWSIIALRNARAGHA